MGESVRSASQGPYRRTITAAVAAALVAGVVVAILDAVLAVDRAGDGGGAGGAVWLSVGLYAIPAIVVGVAAGLVAGAWRATFGDGSLGRAWRRLGADRELDRSATGALLAGAAAAALFAGFAAVASLALVGAVERKATGALLLGVLLVVALPGFALAALPIYRVTRRLAVAVPRLAGAPAAAVLAIGAACAAVAIGGLFVVTRLDWRALNLGWLLLAAAFSVIAGAWLIAWYGPLAAARERIPARGVAVGAVTGVAFVIAAAAVRGDPHPGTLAALTQHSSGARVLIAAARRAADGDGDGYSALLGGPDCDDSRASVHPDAPEVAGNGIDDNCLGGDRAAEAVAPATDPAAAAAPTERLLEFDGNLVLIAVDTLRADRLGVAGYRRDGKSLTPRLDAFAGEAAYFTRVYAQAPNTPRSFPSLFTSQYPSQVKVDEQFKNYSTVLDDNVSLFEALRDGGVHTVGISSHFYFVPERGITQGFDSYDNEGAGSIAESNKDIAAPRLLPKIDARLGELARGGKRFALFAHLFEPHSTYMEHPEWKITERGTAALEQKYDYEIAYVDRAVGQVLDMIQAHGLGDDTMVVIVSDHGEAFGAHRVDGKKMFFHGQTLYDELLRVPLLVRLPGVKPARIDRAAMLIDVAPTIADALGVPRPASFRGRSLLGAMLGRELAPAPVFAELLPAPSWNHSWKMMVDVDGVTKLVYRISDNAFELYDLASDPTEQKDLSTARRDDTARLKAALAAWIETALQEGSQRGP
jgi:arylsulfatase A-like enzyme